MTPKDGDETLVSAARAGDREAFGVLVRRYQDSICAIAYARVRDVEAAQDIAQDAFVTSLEKLRGLRSASRYGAWLAQITRRLCKNWQRSESYRNALLHQVEMHAEARHTDTPEEALSTKERKEIVRRAVGRLPVKAREAVVLYYYRGRSLAEVAQMLGVSEAAVLKRLERGRGRIRHYLAREIEAALEESRPGSDFSQHVLGAISAGSICRHLGLDAGRASVGETLQQTLRAAAEHTTEILTGGVAVMISKKATVAAIGAVILIAGGTGYMILRGGDEHKAPPVAAQPVQEKDSTAPTAEPGYSPSAFAELSTVDEINELLVSGIAELEEMDDETRLDMIRQVVRDALERSMSLELMRDELNFAKQLHADGKVLEALAVYLAVYDVAVNAENYSRVLGATVFPENLDDIDMVLANFIETSAYRITEIFLYEHERKDAAHTFWFKVTNDVANLIDMGVASGRDMAVLLYVQASLKTRTGEKTIGGEGRQVLNASIAEHFEEYLGRDDLTPEDRWLTSLKLAALHEALGRPEAALALYEWLDQEAKNYDFSWHKWDGLNNLFFAAELWEASRDRERINERMRVITQQKQEQALQDPAIIKQVASDFFEGISSWVYDSKDASDTRGLPPYGVQTAHNEWRTWIRENFRDNPIVSIELGEVYKHSGAIAYKMIQPSGAVNEGQFAGSGGPAVPYKLTLRNGTVLEGSLPFVYSPFTQRWQGQYGLDWHLVGR